MFNMPHPGAFANGKRKKLWIFIFCGVSRQGTISVSGKGHAILSVLLRSSREGWSCWARNLRAFPEDNLTGAAALAPLGARPWDIMRDAEVTKVFLKKKRFNIQY